jgi:hypothetical protein
VAATLCEKVAKTGIARCVCLRFPGVSRDDTTSFCVCPADTAVVATPALHALVLTVPNIVVARSLFHSTLGELCDLCVRAEARGKQSQGGRLRMYGCLDVRVCQFTCLGARRLFKNGGGGQRELCVLKLTDGGSRRAPIIVAKIAAQIAPLALPQAPQTPPDVQLALQLVTSSGSGSHHKDPYGDVQAAGGRQAAALAIRILMVQAVLQEAGGRRQLQEAGGSRAT